MFSPYFTSVILLGALSDGNVIKRFLGTTWGGLCKGGAEQIVPACCSPGSIRTASLLSVLFYWPSPQYFVEVIKM